jgi:CRP-like cAMP-binding protein
MALEDDIATLGRAPLFSLMDAEALRLIAFAADHRLLQRGDILFRAGDRSDGGYVVTKGTIRVEGEAGGEPFVAGPGAVIGQIALFTRSNRSATATADEPSAALRVSPTLMRRVLQEFPNAASALHDALAIDLATLSGGLARVRRSLLAIDASKPR